MEPLLLLEDPSLLGLLKPVGMPSQPDPTGAPSLLDWARQRFPEPPLHVVHRVDRPAAGVMVMARGRRAAAALFEQFRERTVEKVYLALTEGVPDPPEGRLEHLLQQQGTRSRVHPEGLPALMTYRTLQAGKTRALVEVRPETGRHHQIRVQMAAQGHPLAGDVKYGARRALREGGIGLFAWRLRFAHPKTQRPILLEAVPGGRAWDPFLEAIPRPPGAARPR